ncbi:epididymal sperm-binding protein 1-like isoform X1 [Hemicordylus capensis]|uniref:epididymal sperm-binding protein 1-like isoform X1 n=1 Tax=Hemicordylus capensis TaxID=884348 RepID=UPI002302E758|nr:epididymal sperm-binding protein 1-like isoform X1 [Hemicordylus capensis]
MPTWLTSTFKEAIKGGKTSFRNWKACPNEENRKEHILWKKKCKETIRVPLPCVFPFIYQQKSYSSCTEINSGKLWCATSANYDKSPQWKYCSLNEYGGNSGGRACVFPFTYKSRTFYKCTNEDAAQGRFWCATTGSYDKDKKWSYCADTRLDANPQGPCVFPFTYKSKSYSSCTTVGTSGGKLWCSLSSNYDEVPKWTYCEPSEPLPCIFPFIFQGKSYSACTKEGAADDQLWCALTPNYDKDSKWKACASQEYEGNSKGQPCVFPFIYKSRTFYTCTNEDAAQGRFWCATTGSYDKDKQWSYCADTRLSSRPTGPCIFPFTYKSKSHSSCTTDGSSDEKPWCSLTKNYDVDQKWTYCDPAGDSNQTGKDHGCL